MQPLIARLAGRRDWREPPRLRARTLTPLSKTPGRLDFQRGCYRLNAAGEVAVATTGSQGSHVFSSFASANCFIVLEQARGDVAVGEWVTIEPFNALLQG